ncbi:rCG42927, isoform CRA_a [Rattus norvegicus]|uniref:RCG42927, isoform CRA_a n=1 Tax=Rattus norvegicus TaxID=10116 RepID=A6JZZ0_RAT|nr:rCG42927, isoform CRA_a [Rattus norvegicus]
MLATRGSGEGRMGSCCLMDVKFQFCKRKGWD